MKYKNQILNFVMFILVVSVIMLVTTALEKVKTQKEELISTINSEWRTQARRSLNNMRSILLEESSKGLVDLNNPTSVQAWCQIHLKGLRNGGETSDGFVVQMGNESFVFDASSDCAASFSKDGHYIVDNYVMHKKPDLAKKAYDSMRELYDTKYGNDVYWQFDNCPELLEWVMIPKEKTGLDNEPSTIGGMRNPKFKAYLIQLGTQEDEIMQPFKNTLLIYDSISIVLQILALLTLLSALLNMTAILYYSEKSKNISGE